MKFTDLSNAEIERRRAESNEALWAQEYQKTCDTMYWAKGQCCAGCDHWISHSSLIGQCEAAGIMSGLDVLKSIGITWTTYTPTETFPYTEASFHCGKFKDDFDWSSLPVKYLEEIGASVFGNLRSKPKSKTPPA